MVAGVGFWAAHGVHAAVAFVSAAALGGGLAIEQRSVVARRTRDRRRTEALQVSLAAAPGLWQGIPAATSRAATGPAATGPAATGPAAPPLRPEPHPAPGVLPLAATGAVGAALVHLVVMPEHFSEWWLYGTFFLVAALVQVAWAVAVSFRPSRQLIRTGVIGSAAVIVLWLCTRLVAVPLGPGAGTTEDVGGLDVLAAAFEFVTVVGGLLCLRLLPSERPVSPHPPHVWAAWAKATGVVAVALAVGVAAVAPVN